MLVALGKAAGLLRCFGFVHRLASRHGQALHALSQALS